MSDTRADAGRCLEQKSSILEKIRGQQEFAARWNDDA
jgi:hypothetical protein